MRNKQVLSGYLGKSFLLFFTLFIGYQVVNPTSADIEAALNVVGLQFTSPEIDSMQDNISENLKDFEEIRMMDIPNGLAPALHFSPIPQNFEFPKRDSEAQFDIPIDIPLPENLDELAWFTIPEFASLIQSKKISCLDLTNFFINRMKKHDKALHCVITMTEERARKQASQLDQEIAAGKYRGILHGIPYGAKDLLAVQGYKTTWGATPFKDQEIDDNATVINKLDAAGAVLIAKLSMGALAWGDVWFDGKTRNPWDPTRGSSGSSAGSASSVSAGLVPFALGTETLGSIVSPSTVCGATGLRPTFGTVSKHGAMALSWSMDKIGPITRSAEDCAIVFNTIKGTDNKDLNVRNIAYSYSSNTSISKLKIGYLKSMDEGGYGFYKNDSILLHVLESKGIELIPIELPDYPPIGFILNAEAAAAFDHLTRSNQDDLLVRQIKNAWPNSFRSARLIPAVEYIQANRLRTKLINDMHETMQKVDMYIHPSWSSSSLYITNMTGHPCVVLPSGLMEGRPTSITITGRLYEEDRLLEFANYVQSITDYDEMHPTLE